MQAAATLSTNSTLADVVSYAIGIINMIIPVLATLALVLFMWAAVRMVMKAGENNSREREALLWGLVALFVLFSIWGILRILQNTLLGASGSSGGASTAPVNIVPAQQ